MKRITLLFTIITLAACGGKKTTATNSAEELTKLKTERSKLDDKIRTLEVQNKDSVKRTPVAVMEVQAGAFNGIVDVQSSITGDENVLATPQAAGVIRSISAHAGQHVGKGQVLAQLDPGPVSQQIAALDAQVNFARTVYEKQQKLWAQQIGTEVQLLQARANFDNASQQRAALATQRNMYRIVSPISGTVETVELKVGDMAMPGTSGIRVTSSNMLKAEAALGENYLGKIKVGDPVTLFFPELGDSIRTKLTFVGQSIDLLSRAFMVQVRLGANGKLHPNMSCRMKIANYQNSNVISIPVNAIQHTREGDVVFVADNGTAKTTKITLGKTSNGLAEVSSGLRAGDKIITEGYQDLDNGSPIIVP